MSTTSQSLKLFWRFTRPYKLLFWGGSVGAALGVIFQDVIPPLIISRAFGRLQTTYGANQSLTFHEMLPYIIGFVISLVAGVIVWRLQAYAVWQYEVKAQRDILTTIFDHLQNQGQRFHADRFGGALVSQTNKFWAGYERFMDEFTWSIIPGLTTYIGSLGVLFVVAPLFGFIFLGISVVYIVVVSKLIKHQFPFNRREAQRESERTAALSDMITNAATVRSFAQENYESARFRQVADASYRASQQLAVETFKNEFISHSLTNTLRITSFVFGMYAITTWGVKVGVLYLVISYTINIVDRLWQFGRLIRNINRSFGDAVEMTEILALAPEISQLKAPEASRIHRGGIEFSQVNFHYDENKARPLFKDLSLRIKAGEKVGLVGHSGGGKTTITKLLLRFMDIQAGEIRIDGQNIAALSLADLRSHIAYVPQEPMLFHRTLLDNIRYGTPDASVETVKAVAKLAHAHEFIEQLPHGYDTLVGERGVKLSGGQRQRVAIARAMLKNAPILVLDEATSALDSESEVLIQDALWKLMEGRTAIVIAHRLSTIQKMDRIVVLNNGQIAEQGSHKELLRHGGVYAQLWGHQSGGFIED